MKLKLDGEFKNLISPMADEEYKQLEENIKKEGCRDSLVVWNGTILDGHNRYKICTEHNLDFKVEEVEFNNREEAKTWIIKNQFGRRNLSIYQRSQLALHLEELYREKAKENQKLSEGGDRRSEEAKLNQGLSNSTKVENPINTREELAKEAGVSAHSIYSAKFIRDNADQDVKEKVESGEWSLDKGYKITKLKHCGREDLVKKVEEGEITLQDAYNYKDKLKECKTCKELKDIGDFYKGLNNCKKCHQNKVQYNVTVTAEEEKEIVESLKEKPPVDGGTNQFSSSIISEFSELVNTFLREVNPYMYIDLKFSDLKDSDKTLFVNSVKELQETMDLIKNNIGAILK